MEAEFAVECFGKNHQRRDGLKQNQHLVLHPELVLRMGQNDVEKMSCSCRRTYFDVVVTSVIKDDGV